MHISLMLIFAQFHFRTDMHLEETAEELEPTAGAVVVFDIYSPGSSSLLSRGI
jgi:hypothetical protein